MPQPHERHGRDIAIPPLNARRRQCSADAITAARQKKADPSSDGADPDSPSPQLPTRLNAIGSSARRAAGAVAAGPWGPPGRRLRAAPLSPPHTTALRTSHSRTTARPAAQVPDAQLGQGLTRSSTSCSRRAAVMTEQAARVETAAQPPHPPQAIACGQSGARQPRQPQPSFDSTSTPWKQLQNSVKRVNYYAIHDCNVVTLRHCTKASLVLNGEKLARQNKPRRWCGEACFEVAPQRPRVP